MDDDVVVGAGHRALDMGLDPLAVSEPVLSPAERLVLDQAPAEEFFQAPRIGVANTDAGFEQRLAALYRRVLGPLCDPASASGCVVLDLCSSWSSHLPPDLTPGQVVGHGMNGEELAAKPRLTSSFVRDLNTTARLPLPDASVGAALCCNGIQYLTRPEWVMAEVVRVLVPGGAVVVSFSDCCWGERATAGGLARSGRERLQLVARVLQSAGLIVVELLGDEDEDTGLGQQEAEGGNANSSSGQQQLAVAEGGDPLFAVVARRPTKEEAEGAQRQVVEAEGRARAGGGGAAGGDAADEGGILTQQQAADAWVGPALREMDLLTSSGLQVTPAVLERWRMSYGALVDDARQLGIPASAIPDLPRDATAAQVRAARDHLAAMIASFLSAGL